MSVPKDLAEALKWRDMVAAVLPVDDDADRRVAALLRERLARIPPTKIVVLQPRGKK